MADLAMTSRLGIRGLVGRGWEIAMVRLRIASSLALACLSVLAQPPPGPSRAR